MIKKDPPARIPQLKKEHRTQAAQAVIDVFSLPGQLNVDSNYVLNTLAQHPVLAQPFLTFNLHLLKTSTLSVRLRQIAIMRVAWLKQSRYVWSSHLRTSLRAGLSDADFEPVKEGEKSSHWNHQERVVLHATDQLIEASDIDDPTWQALSEFFDHQQSLDFLFTVGNYIQLALVCNATRIEREDDLLALAERYGAPL